ncbi:MAG: chemotaxis protein CheD [Methylococcaceae bacterium]
MSITFKPIEIVLKPGDCYFGDRNTRISTVLGSCVSITFWHPQLLVGGMCHYMLPKRGLKAGAEQALDGRYADEAMALLLQEMDSQGTSHKDYQVKLFGGGNMFPGLNSTNQIGVRNVLAARQLIKQHGFICMAEHLGDVGHRQVIFELWSGEVWLKHTQVSPLAEHELSNRSLG